MQKTEFLLAYVQDFSTVIERLLILLKIHTLLKCSRCMWLCLIFYVLQLYKYTITLNSPSAQTSCVYLSVDGYLMNVLNV